MFSRSIFLRSSLELITYKLVQFYKIAANQQRGYGVAIDTQLLGTQEQAFNDWSTWTLGALAQHNSSFPDLSSSVQHKLLLKS